MLPHSMPLRSGEQAILAAEIAQRYRVALEDAVEIVEMVLARVVRERGGR